MDVPLDETQPARSTIGIALARHRASGTAAIGTLVFLPGGPGDSGVDALAREVAAVPSRVRERFDIVGLDPRGIGRSDPVRCSASANTAPPELLPDPVPATGAARASLFAADRSYTRGCAKESGALLARVGTAPAARDLERLRLALGVPQLSFVGQSYGTFLGLAYAEAYPTRVRAMVLDGVVDPARGLASLSLEQASAFDRKYAAFAAWCRASGCAWSSDDPTGALQSLVAQVRAHPLPAERGRLLGPGEVYLGVLDRLYSDAGWSGLGAALSAAERGDGGALRDLSDHYLIHGSSNFVDANTAYNCLDHPAPRSIEAVGVAARVAARTAPIFGPFFAWGSLVCAVWPVRASTRPHVIAAAGSATILVVGATGDPATPYPWARSVAANLGRAALLTVNSDAHVVAFAGACARAVVDRYLADLVAPPAGTTCG
jgi:pimeloyl-ACP methyl ester carboxylesterase